MDQNIVAGLGNIYVCEALHRARLSPKRRASTIAARSGLPNDRARRLVDAIKAVLRAAIKSGGSSLRDHRRTDGALGEFQRNFRVYDRAGSRARDKAATARSNALCRAADQPSSAPYAKNSHPIARSCKRRMWPRRSRCTSPFREVDRRSEATGGRVGLL